MRYNSLDLLKIITQKIACMPALGKDLSKIRSHLGLSIQDVQHHTKIPVSTLRSIENGSIFAHPEENQTYIRSFARSYARALKIDDDVMIKALDQNEAGNYDHLLLEQYPELLPKQPGQDEEIDKFESESKSESENKKEEEEPDPTENELFDQQKSDDDESTEIERIEIVDDEEEVSDEEPESRKSTTASIAEESKPKSTETEKSVKSVDWADVGRKFNQEKKRTPVWIIGLIIILIVAAFLGYFLYENGFLSFQGLMPDQQEEVSPQSETSQSNLSLDLEDSLAASEVNNQPEIQTIQSTPSSELGEVLELTVYAAYDGLGPVRVWTDLKPRMDPYWLEQGTAMHFEFEDTIRVRGPYPDLLLLKDGHLVENAAQEFLQQDEDYLQITRDFFASDPKWATSIDYELPDGVQPPDSIANRPTF